MRLHDGGNTGLGVFDVGGLENAVTCQFQIGGGDHRGAAVVSALPSFHSSALVNPPRLERWVHLFALIVQCWRRPRFTDSAAAARARQTLVMPDLQNDPSELDTRLPLERFPVSDGSRVPYAVFNSPEIYALEQERIYRGKTW